MLTIRSGYLFSTYWLDIVDVTCAAITWSYCWRISVRIMDVDRGYWVDRILSLTVS